MKMVVMSLHPHALVPGPRGPEAAPPCSGAGARGPEAGLGDLRLLPPPSGASQDT